MTISFEGGNPVTATRVAARSLAVLVDGYNISADLAGRIIGHSAGFGALRVKRVYGNAAMLPKWDAAPGFRVIHAGAGKNATDLLLCVQAMALVQERVVDGLVIVSSDRDFTHLATHLTERGVTVIGMGEEKAPAAFRKACTQFVQLQVPVKPEVVKVAALAPSLSAIDTVLRQLVKTQGAGGWLRIDAINPAVQRTLAFKIGSTVDKTWRSYLQNRPELYLCEPRGPNARVRLVKP